MEIAGAVPAQHSLVLRGALVALEEALEGGRAVHLEAEPYVGMANRKRVSTPITLAVMTPPQEMPATPMRSVYARGKDRISEWASATSATACYIHWSSTGWSISP